MLGLYDKDHPETQGSAVFVNREGTAIIGYSRKKLSGETSFRLLTKEIESMPLEKLSKIRASEDFLYPEDIKKYLNERVSQISALMEKKDKPNLTISNSEDIIRKFQEKLTSSNKEQLR